MVTNSQSSNVIAFGGNTMVYESIKRYSVKNLNDLIRVLMENVDDALFELSEKVDNDRERNMYFEAMREIRLKRKNIEEVFDAGVQGSFNRLNLNKVSTGQEPEDGELSMVDLSDIEDNIAIDNMITKARPHFEDDLFAIRERFRVILHRKEIKEDQNPLDPKSICNSFHDASSEIDADIQVKLIFYKLFDKFVMSNLGSFYRGLNDFFITKGVLPEFQASQERLNQTTKYMANRISRSENNGTADNVQNNSLGMESDRHDSTGESSAVDENNVLGMLQQLLQPAGAQVNTGSPTGIEGSLQPLSGADGNLPRGASQGSQVSTSPTMNNATLVALTDLQSANVYSQPLHSVDPQNLKSELQQQLVTFKQENNKQGSIADNQLIDIVSMLFDFFFDDDTLPDPIKVLIGRLQIPILKVAIIDASFFNHKKHPARKLLDSISKATLGWGAEPAQEQLLLDKVEQIVDGLLSDFEEDVSVFDQALEDFNRFIADGNQKVEQNLENVRHEEQEKEQQQELASQAADKVIKKLESKYDFSLEVIDFLEGIWKSVLASTYLAQGESSVHWFNLKKTSSTLIWTLIPKHSEEEKIKLLKTLPPLLRALSKGMDLIRFGSEEKNRVFRMLVQEHSKTIKLTSKNIVTRVDDETVWPDKDMFAEISTLNESGSYNGDIDLLLVESTTGEMEIIRNDGQSEPEKDSVREISHTTTKDVIRNLDDFTDCIVKGEIHIDEEIVMGTDLQPNFTNEADTETDEFLKLAQELEIGSWVEFEEPDAKTLHAKLSWKSNVTGKYVFVNRNGLKVKNMTFFWFAAELRAGRAKKIESVSVFDRAINSFMTTLRK